MEEEVGGIKDGLGTQPIVFLKVFYNIAQYCVSHLHGKSRAERDGGVRVPALLQVGLHSGPRGGEGGSSQQESLQETVQGILRDPCRDYRLVTSSPQSSKSKWKLINIYLLNINSFKELLRVTRRSYWATRPGQDSSLLTGDPPPSLRGNSPPNKLLRPQRSRTLNQSLQQHREERGTNRICRIF